MPLESLSPFIVALITALATLSGVALTQRSARKSVQAQADAAASLDRERRADDARRELLRHERDTEAGKRRERLEAYAEFLSSSDQLRYAGIPTVTVQEASQIAERFSRAEFRLLLVAPDTVAKIGLLVEAYARKLPSSRDKGKDIESLRRTSNLFIREARQDLGIEGDLVAWIESAGKEQDKPA
ncbi:MAG: hypothetical protein ACSLFE_06920 [Gemmatimonadaceae bacterium]